MLKSFPLFQYSLLKPDTNYSIFVVGSRHSGKTTFFEDLWNHWAKDSFDLKIIFSDNPQSPAYHFLTDHDKTFLFPEFNPQIIIDLDYFQNKTGNLLKIGFFFDDCSAHNKHDKMLQQLFIRGRNINASVLFSTQYHLNLTTGARANLDWLFLLDTHGDETRRKVMDTFLWSIIKPLDSNGRLIMMRKGDRQEWLGDWMKENLGGKNQHDILCIDFREGDKTYRYRVGEEASKKRKHSDDEDSSPKKVKK